MFNRYRFVILRSRLSKGTIVVVSLLVLNALSIGAQPPPPFTTGLNHPTKIILAPNNSLLVSESGTMVANTGRISVVDRSTGSRHTLIDGLPSGVSNLGGPPDTDGTTGLFLSGNTLYVISGVGDACINVGPGLELPNPAGASSPIFDSVMEITLPAGFTSLSSSFNMTSANQNDLAAGQAVVMVNSEDRSVIARLVANLPDYRPEPRPGHLDNVRASHLFGVERFQKSLYVNDAAFNLVHKIEIGTGNTSTFAEFPSKPNPLFPALGGPVIEAVPDSIHRIGNRLIVPLLTGFPFIPGSAEVQELSLKDGSHSTLIPGLTSAIDVLGVETDSGEAYFVLEFSSNMLGGSPGRIKYFDSSGSGMVIAPVVITPTSMVRDENGSLYVTNIFPGTLTKITL